MYEILDHLPPEAVVLDLGSGGGSFRHEEYSFTTVHVDLKFEHLSAGHRAVQAQAESLPFLSSTFDAVVLSHVLEHCEQPRRVLQEVGRILRKTGAAFIAVPDARTFSDRLYRKLFRNKGGHVTLFGSEHRLVEDAQWFLGQPHVATRTINSSFSFLNRKNFGSRSKRREILLPPLPEFLVVLVSSAVSRFDRLFGSRASVYGWALYFGHIPQTVLTEPNPNVCIRCGAAEDRNLHLSSMYACSQCGARNLNRSPAATPASRLKRSADGMRQHDGGR